MKQSIVYSGQTDYFLSILLNQYEPDQSIKEDFYSINQLTTLRQPMKHIKLN